jgi:hypothetical protein
VNSVHFFGTVGDWPGTIAAMVVRSLRSKMCLSPSDKSTANQVMNAKDAEHPLFSLASSAVPFNLSCARKRPMLAENFSEKLLHRRLRPARETRKLASKSVLKQYSCMILQHQKRWANLDASVWLVPRFARDV